MSKRSTSRVPLALLIAAVACNERPVSSPLPPSGPGSPVGMVIGTVSGDSLTATFVPNSADFRSASAVSAAIYGGPTTVNVFGTNTVFTSNGGKRNWTFLVAMRNLLSYAIGSNYAASAPPDTSGVFLFFSQTPVVTFPNPCPTCVVNITNAMGTRVFTSTTPQPFYWYLSRPTAKQGTIGTDTTMDQAWSFQQPNFGGADTVHSFTFVLLVSAMWPPPNETSWQVTYDGTADTLPDVNGKPLWKQLTIQGSIGKETWKPVGPLVLSAPNKNKDISFSRFDSLGNMSAFMDITVSVDLGTNGEVAAVFGFWEPAGGRTIMVGVTPQVVEFVGIDSVSTDNAFNQWVGLSGLSSVNASGTVTYRLRKFARDSVMLCVNGSRSLVATYSQMQPLSSNLPANISAFFGLQSQSHKASGTFTSVSYTIGTDGGGCS